MGRGVQAFEEASKDSPLRWWGEIFGSFLVEKDTRAWDFSTEL